MSVANRFSMPGASTEANGLLVTADAAAFGANGSASPGGVCGGRLAASQLLVSPQAQFCRAAAVTLVMTLRGSKRCAVGGKLTQGCLLVFT